MKATIRDVKDSLNIRNITVFATIIALSFALIELLGYVVWRRFPVPSLIVTVAVLGWRIGRRIGHPGLSKVLNAASVGLGAFGVMLWAAAVIDGWYFTVMGYVSWSVQMVMWAWIAFHIWRAWRVIKDMPPDRLMHVTEGTETIYAQMTYRQAQIKTVLKSYDNLQCVHL
jgi:hypothetical protein